ncbi:MAG: 30S ribosomal protein S20 [Candidatus Nomurabacteria bacterium]|jgi:ribosomal protein S20|nr:30S ribosomal protein S20 [Candidatus Nomurabacteria bacterium]
MPIIKSAIKRARQDKKRYAKNLRAKRALREAVKAFEEKPTFEALKNAQSKVDIAVKKRVLEKNNAARKMRRFARIAKAAGVKIPAKPAPVKASAKPAAKKSAAKAPAKQTAPVKKSTTTKKPVAKKPTAKKTPTKKS